MNIGKFLSRHADELAGIADAFATILGSLAIHPVEAEKVRVIVKHLEKASGNIAKSVAAATAEVAAVTSDNISGNAGVNMAGVVGGVVELAGEVQEIIHPTEN